MGGRNTSVSDLERTPSVLRPHKMDTWFRYPYCSQVIPVGHSADKDAIRAIEPSHVRSGDTPVSGHSMGVTHRGCRVDDNSLLVVEAVTPRGRSRPACSYLGCRNDCVK